MATKRIDLGLVQGPSGITPEFSINDEGELIAHYDQGLPIIVSLDHPGYASTPGLVLLPGFVTSGDVVVRGGSYVTVVALKVSPTEKAFNDGALSFNELDVREKAAVIRNPSWRNDTLIKSIGLIWSDSDGNYISTETINADDGVYSFILKSDDETKVNLSIVNNNHVFGVA